VMPVMPMLKRDYDVTGKHGLDTRAIKDFAMRIDKQVESKSMASADAERAKRQFSLMLLDQQPGTHPAQSSRHRAGVVGGSLDMYRAFHTYATSVGHLQAALYTNDKRSEIVTKLTAMADQEEMALVDLAHGTREERAQRATIIRQIISELHSRTDVDASSMDMGKAGQLISDAAFLFYLVGVSYNIVNMTQVPLVAGPELAKRHGVARTSAALGRAYSLVGQAPAAKLLKSGLGFLDLGKKVAGAATGRGGADFNKDNWDVLKPMRDRIAATERRTKDPRAKRMLQFKQQLIGELVDEGHISMSMAMDSARVGARSHVNHDGSPRKQGAWEWTTDWMRAAPHTTEIMNRAVTATAAFELEFNRLVKAEKTTPSNTRISEMYQQAKEYARETTDQTQFVYNASNRPPIMRGSVGRTMLMFKQHPMGIYWAMFRNMHQAMKGADLETRKEARKGLALFVGMHLIAAGAIGGTPEPLKWMMWLAMWALGMDDEYEFERFIRETTSEAMGPEAGLLISKGLPAYLGVDISQRVGINNLLTFKGIDTSGRDSTVASVASMVLGPALDMSVGRMSEALQHYNAGRTEKAFQVMMPKAIRDPWKAYNMAEGKGFVSSNGEMYFDSSTMSAAELATAFLGFSPTRVGEVYSARGVRWKEQQINRRRSNMLSQYYKALRFDDESALSSVLDDMSDFNRQHLGTAFTISHKQLKGYVTRKWKRERSQIRGVSTTKRNARWAYQQTRPYARLGN